MEERFLKQNLIDAILRAKAASDVFSAAPDEGTYNFDTPVIMLPDGYDITCMRTREFLEDYGFWLEQAHGDREGYYFINGICSGAQSRRTKRAEAVADSLIGDGYEAVVYYQMD